MPQDVPDSREKRPENVACRVRRERRPEDIAKHHSGGHKKPVLPTDAFGGSGEIVEPLFQQLRLRF